MAQPQSRTSGVQTLERAFTVLEQLADAGGSASLSELTARCDLPTPTIHRLVRTLVSLGYVRQDPSRRYALGPRLIKLGDSAGRFMGQWAQPILHRVVDEIGETANLAVLDGDSVVYVAQVPSKHAMRMFTEVGARVHAHCTAVGKVLLAGLPAPRRHELLQRTGMPAQTPATITDPATLLAQVETIEATGYGIDDGERELGVRCVAVPVPDAPTLTALSVSGPEARLTPEAREEAVPQLQRAAAELGVTLSRMQS